MRTIIKQSATFEKVICDRCGYDYLVSERTFHAGIGVDSGGKFSRPYTTLPMKNPDDYDATYVDLCSVCVDGLMNWVRMKVGTRALWDVAHNKRSGE